MNIQETSGHTFSQSLLAKRDFHNPNMAEFLKKLGGLNEWGTNLQEYNECIWGDDVPDFERMGHEQRADWERRSTTNTSRSTTRNVPFVSAKKSTIGPASYAALLQERRNQHRR